MDNTYEDFLLSKIKVADRCGIQIDTSLLHTSTKPHQRDIIEWNCLLGKSGVFAGGGLGKTHIGIETLRMLHLLYGGKHLIVTELGASETFTNQDPEVGEGARLGVKLEYVTSTAEAIASECNIVVTNYERVRMGSFDFSKFTGVWLDEGNYIKNMASETTDMLKMELAKVKWKFVATATPSPNETLELINYAHVLGICDRGQILTRFFQRNSVKAGELTLHPHHEEDFWLWVYSWATFVTRPSDLGYPDEGYELPLLNVYWHEVSINKAIDVKADKDGQGKMFIDGSASLPDAARVKRESIEVRLTKALQVMGEYPSTDHWLIWHHLEDERKALNKAFKDHASYGDIYGSMDWETREKRIVDFTKGSLQIMATKPGISGVGCNFQKHCHDNILLGVNHSFDEFLQLLLRTWRFGQTHPVNVHVIYTPEEYEIVNNLKKKWEEHDIVRAKMRELSMVHGLNFALKIEERRRSFKTDRKQWEGINYKFVNNDSVFEIRNQEDNSADMILTSIPFGNHYEYSDKYNDFGHNQTNADFFRQMDFLVPQMLRVLKPGRIAAIHTKNRIHYGSVTGLGFSTMHRFSHAACDSFERHGFQTMGFHFIPTDVVAENNQTYRLTYGELQKDATKMGAGIPEEIWIFRKPPTSNANAYADTPVTHNMARCPLCGHEDVIKEFRRENALAMDCPKCRQFFPGEDLQYDWVDEYSLADWQIDADCFWRSSGDRYLQPDELKGMSMKQVRAWWNKFNAGTVYARDQHAELLQMLDDAGKLSRTFTTLPLRSNTPHIWNDVNRMHGLNLEQSRRKQQNHICPMPYDQVDRLIELYSNPGERIDDYFGGLGTTPLRAIKKGRYGFGCELNSTYAQCASFYLKQAENHTKIPTLFDVLTA